MCELPDFLLLSLSSRLVMPHGGVCYVNRFFSDTPLVHPKGTVVSFVPVISIFGSEHRPDHLLPALFLPSSSPSHHDPGRLPVQTQIYKGAPTLTPFPLAFQVEASQLITCSYSEL